MSVITTELYAGLLGLLNIAIPVSVGRLRVATGISDGDGGEETPPVRVAAAVGTTLVLLVALVWAIVLGR